MAHPRGIVEPHGECPCRPRPAAAAPCAAIPPVAHGAGGTGTAASRVEPPHLGEMQPVGLAAARVDAESLLPDARQSEQTVRQLMEIDDLRERADVVSVGFRHTNLAALADQHHAEALAFAHAASHHVDVARLEDTQRQRAVRKQHDVERKEGDRDHRRRLALAQCGEQLLVQSAEAAVAHHEHLVTRLRLPRPASCTSASTVPAKRTRGCSGAIAARQIPSPAPGHSRTRCDRRARAPAPAARDARRASWCWSAARAPR